MKICNPLKNCTSMSHNLTNPIKNYAHGVNERKSTPRDVPQREDQRVSTPNTPDRQHKLRKALRRIFRSKPRQVTPERTGPFVPEDRPSSRTHYPNSAFEGAYSHVQTLYLPSPNLNLRRYLQVDHGVHDYLDLGRVVPQENISFVDSGYGVDAVPHDRDLFSSANTDVDEFGSFLNHNMDRGFLTGPDSEEELFLPVFGDVVPVSSAGVQSSGTDSPHSWSPTEDFGVLTSDEAIEQSSLTNMPAISSNDGAAGVIGHPPHDIGLTLVEEQAIRTFLFNASESGWTTSAGLTSPELSPVSMDFPALTSLPPGPGSLLTPQAYGGHVHGDGPPHFRTSVVSTPSASAVQQRQPIGWSTLPTELLQDIFFRALPEQTLPDEWKLDTPWPRPNHGDALLVLRKVCRHWNNTALAPFVWNANAVAWSVAKPTVPDSKARLACITSHSEYTNTIPVDTISYEIGSERMTFISDEIMDAVYRPILNCRAARIVLPWEREILNIDLIQMHSDAVQDMPRLRVLSWTSPYTIDATLPPRWRLPWTSLKQAPWKQLTACFLDCPLTVEDCLFILKHYPGLKTLGLGHIISSTTLPNNNPDSSPKNENLSSFGVSSAVDINILISNIQLPNLTDLHLDLTSGDEEEPMQQLQRLNFPWGSLKSLVLKCAMDLSAAYQLFQECHSVTRLEWHWPDSGDVIVPVLMSDPLIGLPSLRNLTITPTLPPHVVRSLLETLRTQITSSTRITLPSLPQRFWSSARAFEKLSTIALTSPISATQCLSIMNWSEQLKELDVLVDDISLDSMDAWPDHVRPAKLKCVILRTPVKNLGLLFHAITLPSLTAFELIFKVDSHSTHHWAGDHRHGTHQQGLHSLLHRSRSTQGTPLKRLVLDGIDIKAADLEAIINTATSVETDLHITDTTIAKSSSTQNITSVIVASVTAGQNYSSRTALHIYG